MERNHYEEHYVSRVGWLRAAVLGANDGIVSTAALIVGVAAASDRSGVMLAGMAGLAAGALSMAAGEYVSVSSQADTEKADTERERAEIEADQEEELRALAGIYEDRGLSPDLALQVATALHAKDPLAAHLRDELGFSEHTEAKPLVAAGASALSFAVGAAMPMAAANTPALTRPNNHSRPRTKTPKPVGGLAAPDDFGWGLVESGFLGMGVPNGVSSL